jgi:hypothetical protein
MSSRLRTYLLPVAFALIFSAYVYSAGASRNATPPMRGKSLTESAQISMQPVQTTLQSSPRSLQQSFTFSMKGRITDASGTTNQKWLESAFLEKQAGSRKIIFMHSTRVATASKDNHGK